MGLSEIEDILSLSILKVSTWNNRALSGISGPFGACKADNNYCIFERHIMADPYFLLLVKKKSLFDCI